MSHITYLEYTALRLVFFHQECTIGFLTHNVFYCPRMQRVWPWLLVINLHPDWWKHIYFASITKSLLFVRVFTIESTRRYWHPTGCFRYYLKHWRRLYFFTLSLFLLCYRCPTRLIWSLEKIRSFHIVIERIVDHAITSKSPQTKISRSFHIFNWWLPIYTF